MSAPTSSAKSQRLLAIRLQAMGDLVITLPYLQALKRRDPTLQLDLLTREEVAEIPTRMAMFERVHTIGGGRSQRRQYGHALAALPKLLARRYDTVADLQNNPVSRLVTSLLPVSRLFRFDRFAPQPAGMRTAATLSLLGFGDLQPDYDLDFSDVDSAVAKLEAKGWLHGQPTVVVNPAGLYVTRNWPLERYVEFCSLWTRPFPGTRFLLLGLPAFRERAAQLQEAVGDSVINLVGDTSPAEAFTLVRRAQLVLSEDSGLMHMAWVNGVPTVALFGSSRSDWSRPLGGHSRLLGSDDLSCGSCMRADCLWGDVRCLTRYTPKFVYDAARQVVTRQVAARPVAARHASASISAP